VRSTCKSRDMNIHELTTTYWILCTRSNP